MNPAAEDRPGVRSGDRPGGQAGEPDAPVGAPVGGPARARPGAPPDPPPGARPGPPSGVPPAAPLPLAQRREQLLVRSAELRLRLAQDGRALEAPLAMADTVRTGWHWLRAHPEWPAGAALLLVLLKPRRALRWASRGWWAWRTWQRAQRLLAAAGRRQAG